ncbi:MAG: TMEM165/GDT1 family protein [Acidimicrobiales bacterium]
MNLAVAASVFPVIFLGELPDKTMFASLALAARGRPVVVWLGAAIAFTVHVVIAVSAGVALYRLLPTRVVDAVVAGLFGAGAVYSFLIRDKEEEQGPEAAASTGASSSSSNLRSMTSAAGVIFLAEWGDLTQILTANLAARYNDPLSVGAGALAALLLVAGLAVATGRGLIRLLRVRTLRLATAAVLAGLAVYTAVLALT